jgi:hypothetical protein
MIKPKIFTENHVFLFPQSSFSTRGSNPLKNILYLYQEEKMEKPGKERML